MAAPEIEFTYKILLIGDVSVGKTSFLIRYMDNKLTKTPEPNIGVEFRTKSLVLRDGTVGKAQVWDTSGSERYKSITTAHYRSSVGALLFFDLTDRISYENTLNWLKEIKKHAEYGVVVVLVGNKKDLVKANPSSRKVTEAEAKELAAEHGLFYRETSAKTGDNVKETFEFLVETIYKYRTLNLIEQKKFEDSVAKELDKRLRNQTDTTEEPRKSSKWCCS